MDKREASVLAARVLSRYPAGRSDDGVLAVWTEEILTRFGRWPETKVREMAADYCRRNPSSRPPGVDELCSWVAERLRAEAAEARRLPEPAFTEEQIAANKARLRRIVASVSR